MLSVLFQSDEECDFLKEEQREEGGDAAAAHNGKFMEKKKRAATTVEVCSVSLTSLVVCCLWTWTDGSRAWLRLD